MLQFPIPINGVFAARVAAVAHKVWFGPAAAVVGPAFIVTLVVAVPMHVPLLKL